jgi:oligo-1,6-glucosidase
MQWDASPHAGFTAGEPWIAVNPNHTTLNAAAERADPDSVFHHYRRLIALRGTMPVIVDGGYELIEAEDPNVAAYRRMLDDEQLLVVCNFSGATPAFGVPDELAGEWTPLIGNYPAEPIAAGTGRTLTLRPWEGVVFANR